MYKAQREPKSLLNWLQHLIVIRKRCTAIGLGALEIMPSKQPGLFMHVLQWKCERLLFLHNFSSDKISLIKAEYSKPDIEWVPVFYAAKTQYSKEGNIVLEGHDYMWLRADFTADV
jgi:maltose alpha-D-glucosyltransferase/alpha-amylase